MTHTGMMGETNFMDMMETSHASAAAADTHAMMGACGNS